MNKTLTRNLPAPAGGGIESPAPADKDFERLRDDTWWYGSAAMLAFLVAWEALVYALDVPELYLPRPSAIAGTLWTLFADKHLGYDTLLTLARIFGGFFLAAFVGIALGVLMATSKRLYAVCDIFVSALYPIPKISLVPLLVIWLGSGEAFLIVLSALACLFPILLNTIIGVRQCDDGLVLAARDLGATRQQILRRVILPAAVPAIFAGLRLGLGISIIMIIAAEMQTAKFGLGARLQLAGQILETGQVFAILVLLAVIGVVVNKGQEQIDKLVSRWRTR